MRYYAGELRPLSILLTTCLLSWTAPGWAQRANESALRSAEDAFGSSIGSESIGLYTPNNVRGFNPYEAGNVRLEGLFLDVVSGLNARLIRGSTVRVGISAQGYPFPAPTGIADYRLRLPGDKSVISSVIGVTSIGSFSAEVDIQQPIIPSRLAFSGGLNISHDEATYSAPAYHIGGAGIVRWNPSGNIEITPFWGLYVHRKDPAPPRFIVSGSFLPPQIERNAKLAQSWALNDTDVFNYGILTRGRIGEFTVRGGLFRLAREVKTAYSDQFLGVSATGLALRHRINATPDQKFASTSGEVRISRELKEEERKHTLHLAARGRLQSRQYGGSASVELGPTLIGTPHFVTKPLFSYGLQSHDKVRQFSLGLAYEGRWPNVGELSLGLQKTHYVQNVLISGRPETTIIASPWLYNGSLAFHVSRSLALYGSFTRGLEESAVAPETAFNRDEAPPAILTQQYDAGLRWVINENLRFVAGFFNVEKPYFSLDENRLYRRLGKVRHRGAELSLVGNIAPDLTLVAGAILLDARVQGEAVVAGLIGKRPVGSVGRTITFNADYDISAIPGLSIDLALNSFSRRAANTINSLSSPAIETIDVGMRYRHNLGKIPAALRIQITNLFNRFGWDVVASNTFFYNSSRLVSIRLTTDF